MDTGLRIDSPAVTKETAQQLERLIVNVLKAGYQSHADQETIRHALSVVERSVAIKDVTISHCSITDGTKNINT